MSSVIIAGNTSGSVTLEAPAVSGTTTLTLPATTDTLVGKTTTDTLTNKTLTSPTISGTPVMSASVITLQNDSDGKGDYIAKWEHPTLVKPTDEQLGASL